MTGCAGTVGKSIRFLSPRLPTNGQDIGHSGMAPYAQGTREQIHQSAEEVSQGSVGKNFHTTLDNIFFRSVNVQQFRPENIDKDAHDERYGNGQNHTVPEYQVHSLILADTVILTGKNSCRPV